MIPKKLHYVWLGGQPIPDKYQQYIDDWSRIMPDWEVVRWDESNFDVNCSVFCKQAYEAKRWAFVSDYVRVKVLYEEGGIYLDTDEEMVQSLDRFAYHKAFFGMEAGLRLQAGVFGCEPKNEIMAAILEYYNQIEYIENDKQNNIVIGTHFLNVLKKIYPIFELKEEITELSDGVVVYPSQFFCPEIATLKIDENCYTIHRFNGSWLPKRVRLRIKLVHLIYKIFPIKKILSK